MMQCNIKATYNDGILRLSLYIKLMHEVEVELKFLKNWRINQLECKSVFGIHSILFHLLTLYIYIYIKHSLLFSNDIVWFSDSNVVI